VPAPPGFPPTLRSNRALWWANARLKELNRRSLSNSMLPEWMHYDRHLNALMIEPSLCNNKADFEDQYVVSIFGNDQLVS